MSFPPPPLPNCTRHPDRPTGRSCTRCARPACGDCLVQADVGSKCLDCVRRDRPSVRTRATYWNASQPLLVTKLIIAIAAMGNGEQICQHIIARVVLFCFFENGRLVR